MMEAMLILSTIARHYDVERAMEFPVKPIASVSLRPEGGVWVRARRRA
jgi:cytochrome P450